MLLNGSELGLNPLVVRLGPRHTEYSATPIRCYPSLYRAISTYLCSVGIIMLMEPERRQLTRDDVLNGREVAELLHLPASTVREFARRGVLPAHRLGRRWGFIHDEVAAALRAAPQFAPPRQPSVVAAGPARAGVPVVQLVLPIDGP